MVKFCIVEKLSDITADILPSKPYCVAIEADFEACGNDARWTLAELLVKTDAMWVAGVGRQSTLLDDDVDMVCVNRGIAIGNSCVTFPDVMTTWHDDENLDEVVDLLSNINFDFEKRWGVSEWDIVSIKVGSEK